MGLADRPNGVQAVGVELVVGVLANQLVQPVPIVGPGGGRISARSDNARSDDAARIGHRLRRLGM